MNATDDLGGPNARLREKAERILNKRGEADESVDDLSAWELKALIHELRVHQTELEIQNQELRDAQTKLESLKEEYRDLYEFAPVGYLTVSAKGLICGANDTAEQMLGVSGNELMGAPMSRFVQTEDQFVYYLRRGRLLETGEPQSFEADLIRRTGGSFPARIDTCPVRDENGTVIAYRLTMSNMTESKRAQVLERDNERLTAEDDMNRTLLREVHHRVKNNLAVIAAVLSMRSMDTTDTHNRAVLEDLQTLIKSLALAHDMLHGRRDLSDVDLRAYVHRLLDCLYGSISGAGLRIETSRDVDSVACPVDTATAIGMIVAELVTNCVRHAFEDRDSGRIHVSLKLLDAKEMELLVSDDGTGPPADVDFNNPTSTGLEIVRSFVDKLKGRLEVDRQGGTAVRVVFPTRQEGEPPRE